MSEVDERLSVVTKKLLESAFVAIANPTYPLCIVLLIRVQSASAVSDLGFVLADGLPVEDGRICGEVPLDCIRDLQVRQ